MHDTDEIMDSLDEVFGLEEEDGDHTDLPEDTDAQDAEPEEQPQEAAGEPETGDNSESERLKESEKIPADGNQEPEKELSKDSQQFITVKYDGQTQNVSLEDAPGLIQKGMNYDRMQERLDGTEREKQTLQEKLNEQEQTVGTLEMIAQTLGVSIPNLLDQLHVNAVKSTGKTEAEARAIIKADKLERQLKSQKQAAGKEAPKEDEKTEKVARELAEFRKQYPDVNLGDAALVERMRPYIQKGMSLTAAYLKQENARQAEEIARLQQEQAQKQAAQEKNKKNRTTTPGSMQDSGGSRGKDLADLFEEELFR